MSNDQSQDITNGMQNVNLNNQEQKYNPNGAQSFVPNFNAQSFVPNQQFNQYGQGQYQQQQQQQQYNNYNQYSGQQQQGYNNYNNNSNSSRGSYNNRGGFNNNYNNYNNNYNNYNNNYNSNRGYNNYNSYDNNYNQQYDQQQSTQDQGSQQMSLDDYKKQQEENQAKLNAKPKRTIKLNLKSSTVKTNAPKKVEKKEEPKKEEPMEEAKASETEKKSTPAAVDPVAPAAPTVSATPASSSTTTVKTESKKEEPATKSTPSAAAKTAAPKKDASASTNADLIAKEQADQIDPSVVSDMFGGKDHLSIIFMGHVDAGKSTMGGNILFLTGAVDKRTVEKYEREAKDAGRQGWYLSWIMDTNKEERNDGKTIEVGKSYFETEKRRYTILDAPGHKLYISEMIGGASQADVGILVISARKGEYEAGFERGGQSREHAMLAKTQGVNKLVVVINKMDDPTVNWSKERYDECTSKLAQYLKAIGFQKSDFIFMPVSGFSGAGLKERVKKDEAPWYTGPALLEYLDAMPLENRKINDPFMLPISGKMKDLGTVVEGKIESGHIKKNQQLLLMPNKIGVEVLTIYNETEAEADSAFCGEQVRLKIKGVEEEDISPGYVLSSFTHPVKTTTKFEAQIAIVELKSILSTGFSCVMHIHTAIEEVTFTALLHKLEKGTNRKSKKAPAFAKQGMKIIAVLETTEPVCIESYDDYPQLGRFTLRDQGQTIAIGKVTKLL